MKLDALYLFHDLAQMPALTRAVEAAGFDGLWVSETRSDPFLSLALAAEHSTRLTLGTAIAVAFPRSPTTLAHLAWDLSRYSGGRFVLGLGSQVRAHNERRFGVKWEKPVRKLRETIEAIHAVWETWQTGAPLDYQGEFFQLNLMTPFFSTGPLPHPRPPIYISAVNEMMLKLAGRRCDGVHLHALHTERYLREFARPTIAAGLAETGRSWADFTTNTGLFVVPTDGEKPTSHYEQWVRQQLSFYMSTPAYRVVVELHGWQETAFRLSKMARRGQWEAMPAEISDEMLDAFAVSGPWGRLPGLIRARYGDMLDRVSFYLDYKPGAEEAGWAAAIAGFRALQE